MRLLALAATLVALVAVSAGQALGAEQRGTGATATERATAAHGLPWFGKYFIDRIRRAHDFESYVWNQIQPDAPWEARTGLQVVDLKGTFYLMGGRTPTDVSGVPGEGIIHGDVWRSTDDGVTWKEIVPDTAAAGAWPPRAFFSAVRKGKTMYVLGGQDFQVVPNDCSGPPPPGVGGPPVTGPPPGIPARAPAGVGGPPGGPPACPPFISVSNFFNDVWSSTDGINWELRTAAAPWEGRAGLMTVVHRGAIYVFGGSKNDDEAVIGGPPLREYFNDVWKSYDGRHWKRVTPAAPWAKRAGGAAVVKDGYMYLMGGEAGFACQPLPDCTPPYFNDVWRSKDGKRWQQVTPAADWSPRPGHKCGVLARHIVCFGGFGLLVNPSDVWVSKRGKNWRQVSDSPWNATNPDEVRYDFALVSRRGTWWRDGAIYTFGGDRERFDLPPSENVNRVDDDVWTYSPAPSKLKRPK